MKRGRRALAAPVGITDEGTRRRGEVSMTVIRRPFLANAGGDAYQVESRF